MKLIKFVLAALAIACTASQVQAQVVKKTSETEKKKSQSQVSSRQKDFYEVAEPSDADLQWKKIVYRELDLTKGKNAALYYPEEPNEDGESLFYIIMRRVANGEILLQDQPLSAYPAQQLARQIGVVLTSRIDVPQLSIWKPWATPTPTFPTLMPSRRLLTSTVCLWSSTTPSALPT